MINQQKYVIVKVKNIMVVMNRYEKYKKKKYKAIKYANDDAKSWAVFLSNDITGLRSPISQYTKAKPLITNYTRSQAYNFIKQLEKNDEKNNNVVNTNN